MTVLFRSARRWTGNPFTIEHVGDRSIAVAVEVLGEDPPHHICRRILDNQYSQSKPFRSLARVRMGTTVYNDVPIGCPAALVAPFVDHLRVHGRSNSSRTSNPGLADNSVGKVIENLLRHDLLMVDELGFAPLDDTGAQLLFRFVAAAYERRSRGIASHWPFESWGRSYPSSPPRSASSTGSCTTATPSSPTATPTE